MKLIVRIPDEFAERVRRVESARLERAALEAVLRIAEDDARDQRAISGIASGHSPQEAVARKQAARPANRLPAGVSIRDLMTYGRRG